MAGLVGYGSSDDEEGRTAAPVGTPKDSLLAPARENGHHEEQAGDVALRGPNATAVEGDGIQGLSQVERVQSTALGPTAPPADQLNDDGRLSSLSPHAANRAAIRNLTMPTLPNFDIPLSPPGSPPPGTEEKFERFLQLKKQGLHFNEKLAGSSALKNPALLQKLMSSAGLLESDQYVTTLPTDVWDPSAFPDWAYKEELTESQQQIAKRKEEEISRGQREKLDFVPAANIQRTINGNDTTPRLGAKAGRRSAAERVAAGLDQQRMQSRQVLDRKSRGELERKGGG